MIAARKKVITLHFKRDELLYDIKNVAYVIGDTTKTEREHDKHQIIDIGEDGNVDRVTRILDLGIAHCAEVLYPYSKIPVVETARSAPQSAMGAEYEMATDDVLEETPEYTISLLVPDDFSETTITYLERLIHELLVCWVLWDWLGVANADSQKWGDKMKGIEDMLTSTLNGRCGRVRKTQTPF